MITRDDITTALLCGYCLCKGVKAVANIKPADLELIHAMADEVMITIETKLMRHLEKAS